MASLRCQPSGQLLGYTEGVLHRDAQKNYYLNYLYKYENLFTFLEIRWKLDFME